MLVAKIKRFLGLGLLLALDLGVSTNYLWAAEAIINHNQSLLDTAEAGELDLVVTALNDGADINFRDAKSDETALTSAARNGYTEMVHLLLDRGANPNIQGPRGATAVILAAMEGHIAVLDALLAAGAMLDMRDYDQETALIASVANDQLATVQYLLNFEEINSDVDSMAEALVWALDSDLPNGNQIAQALLIAGAKKPIVAVEEVDPLDTENFGMMPVGSYSPKIFANLAIAEAALLERETTLAKKSIGYAGSARKL
ncbi:MAG TPA: ankyrin repeat domain-containing protein [Candidatus Babeliales bacterium]|nr:ankyrin repeat domain-containing protein [Candidatus Babeliales bacterium]